MKQLLLAICIAASVTAMAQKPKPQFGIIAGLNLASQTAKADNEKSSSKIKPGLAIGALVELPVSKTFSIEPQVLFSMLGGHDEDGGEKATTKFNYIMLPVLAKFNFKAVSVYAGPQIGFLMSARAKYEFDGESEEGDIKDGFKSTDFFGVIGADINLGGGVSFGAGYQAGLANIFKENELNSSYHNNNIQIHFAYKFAGKKKSS